MAQRRDSKGRFAGGGGGGGKVGKSAKNQKARTAYKNASGKARAAVKEAASKKPGTREAKFFNQQAGGAKSGLTRVTNRLSGKKAASKAKAAPKAKAAAPKATGNAASKKQALVKKVSSAALKGKKPTAAQSSYLRAQQGEKMALESRGKGSKAARRMANRR